VCPRLKNLVLTEGDIYVPVLYLKILLVPSVPVIINLLVFLSILIKLPSLGMSYKQV